MTNKELAADICDKLEKQFAFIIKSARDEATRDVIRAEYGGLVTVEEIEVLLDAMDNAPAGEPDDD